MLLFMVLRQNTGGYPEMGGGGIGSGDIPGWHKKGGGRQFFIKTGKAPRKCILIKST